MQITVKHVMLRGKQRKKYDGAERGSAKNLKPYK